MADTTSKTLDSVAGLGAGNSFSTSLDAEGAEEVRVFVDNSAGSAAGSYDLLVEADVSGNGDYMPVASIAGSTALAHTFTGALPNYDVRLTITNATTSAGDYRVGAGSVSK